MIKNTKKLGETYIVLLSGLFMVVVGVIIIMILLVIERNTLDWAPEIWGVVFFVLSCIFGICFHFGYEIIKKINKKREEVSEQNVE
jgi:hypothetical protein